MYAKYVIQVYDRVTDFNNGLRQEDNAVNKSYALKNPGNLMLKQFARTNKPVFCKYTKVTLI